MIINAAYEIARTRGAEFISARNVAKMIDCSTQPVMYQFATIEELRMAAYAKAQKYHISYIENTTSENPLLDVSLNYIRFAQHEKGLFKFLYQTAEFEHKSITGLITSDESSTLLSTLAASMKLSDEQAQFVFRHVFVCVHGYASMFANNSLEYDEKQILKDVRNTIESSIESARRS